MKDLIEKLEENRDSMPRWEGRDLVQRDWFFDKKALQKMAKDFLSNFDIKKVLPKDMKVSGPKIKDIRVWAAKWSTKKGDNDFPTVLGYAVWTVKDGPIADIAIKFEYDSESMSFGGVSNPTSPAVMHYDVGVRGKFSALDIVDTGKAVIQGTLHLENMSPSNAKSEARWASGKYWDLEEIFDWEEYGGYAVAVAVNGQVVSVQDIQGKENAMDYAKGVKVQVAVAKKQDVSMGKMLRKYETLV